MTSTSPDQAAAADAPPRRRWSRRIVRIVGGALLIGVVLVGIGLFVVTRSSFIISRATPELERRLGGDVQIGHASYLGDGMILLEELTLQARGLEGPAARVLAIERAVVQFEPTKFLRGQLELQHVNLDNVVVRLSEESDDSGEFNFALLDPDWSFDADDDPFLPPTVRINSASIEQGMHTGADYELVGERRVAGEMHPSAAEEGWYTFELGEIDERGIGLGESGILVKGQWNVETFEHEARINGLALDRGAWAMCPRQVRDWWENMDLQGDVGKVVIEWKPGGSFVVELTAEAVGLTMPIVAEDFWARYQQGRAEAVENPPRMMVRDGTIRFEPDRLVLTNLVGELESSGGDEQLVGVPYLLNLSIHDLPDWDARDEWVERLLDTAPFTMKLRLDDFELPDTDDDQPPAVELPQQVAGMLSRFHLTGWTLSTEVDVRRAAPMLDESGTLVAQPILTNGQTYIKNASGAFDKFPYPLEGIDAYVQFDNDTVTVVYLTGHGSDNATVRIEGLVSPPGPGAAIDLTLIAHDVPLDDRMRTALSGPRLKAFDSLLHRESFDSLQQAGLLIDENALIQAAERRGEVRAQLGALPAATDDEDAETKRRRESLLRELVGLEALINAGPFELGGVVDLDLKITREFGADRQTFITGGVTVQSAGVVFDRFPYPVRALGGELTVERDRITFNEGIPVLTPGGGRGVVRGELLMRRAPGEPMTIEPKLRATVADDKLNDALLAAIPGREAAANDEDAIPFSIAGQMLRAAGLQGWLDYGGTVTSDDHGKTAFDFAVRMNDGAAEPQPTLIGALHESGLLWPEGFAVEDVEGLLRITPDAVHLVDVKARRGDGQIAAQGVVRLDGDEQRTQVAVQFDNLAIEQYLVNLAPRQGFEYLRELWDRFQPRGAYDAQLNYVTHRGGDATIELRMEPRDVDIAVGEKRLTLTREGGAVLLRDDEVVFDNLRLQVDGPDRSEGVVHFTGAYGASSDKEDLRLQGDWTGGNFDSPAVVEILRLIGAEAEAERCLEHAVAGSFDAEFRFDSASEHQQRRYSCTLHPHDVALQIGDDRINVTFADGARAEFTPGRIEFTNLAGQHEAGAFNVNGHLLHGGQLAAALDIQYDGVIDHPAVRVFMPVVARNALDAMQFTSGQGIQLENGRLEMIDVRTDRDIDSPPQWSTTFDGRFHTTDASFAAAISFDEVESTLDVHIASAPNQPPVLEVIVDAARCVVLNRPLTEIEARVVLGDDGRRIEIPELRATLCGGVVSARAFSELGEQGRYELLVQLVGASLAQFAAKDADDDADGASSSGSGPAGQLYGSLEVGGRRDDPFSRRGRGSARVFDGRLVNMPVVLRLLQLIELMPPVAGSLEFADAEFYVDGNAIVFEQLSLEGPTLQLVGTGQMGFESLELNVIFRPRGTLSIVRELVAGLSDQLVAIEVTGPLSDPVAQLIPLPIVVRPGGEPSRRNEERIRSGDRGDSTAGQMVGQAQ